MAEQATLYNFGVLTKRYELVSRTARQLAPGVVGAATGLVMLLASMPMPLPVVPVVLGFWFALGRMPCGPHRGTKVRALAGPYLRYRLLCLGGRDHWEMPQTWLRIVVGEEVTTPPGTENSTPLGEGPVGDAASTGGRPVTTPETSRGTAPPQAGGKTEPPWVRWRLWLLDSNQ